MAIAQSFLQYHHENGTVAFIDCYTSMQLADFLTKSLGPQQYTKLTAEAMGESKQTDLTKFSRRNWKEKYEEEMQSQANARMSASVPVQVEQVQVLPHTAQGGVLKYGYLDLVYCNCMRVPMEDTNMHVICSSIEDYIKYDQHSSSVLAQVQAEDFKAEKSMYGDITLCKHINVTVK